jgi:hypothetical protein
VGMKQANDKKPRMLTSGMSLYTMRHHDGAPEEESWQIPVERK